MKKIIGIMTGNSLDGCDIILSAFNEKKMQDIATYSASISKKLQQDILNLKSKIQEKLPKKEELVASKEFRKVHDKYIIWIAKEIKNFLKKNELNASEIDAIGFHGQTLIHFPPSIAKNKEPFTLQMGSGKMLSNLTNIPVIYDFRSDDMMNGGEGAPLMPPHNEHIASNIGLKNACFYNAGNTSNLAIIADGKLVQGYDAGPFNEFNDKIMRNFYHKSFDKNANCGKKGALNLEILAFLFNHAAMTNLKENFLDLKPPKSADPSIYQYEKLIEFAEKYNMLDVLHTTEYFSAYVAVYALKHVNRKTIPNDFVLFGGGWSNPICLKYFKQILEGQGVILKGHESVFKSILEKIKDKPKFHMLENAKYMEARLMADLAWHKINKKFWADKKVTGATRKSILGIQATKSTEPFDDLISRAYKGWKN